MRWIVLLPDHEWSLVELRRTLLDIQGQWVSGGEMRLAASWFNLAVYRATLPDFAISDREEALGDVGADLIVALERPNASFGSMVYEDGRPVLQLGVDFPSVADFEKHLLEKLSLFSLQERKKIQSLFSPLSHDNDVVLVLIDAGQVGQANLARQVAWISQYFSKARRVALSTDADSLQPLRARFPGYETLAADVALVDPVFSLWVVVHDDLIENSGFESVRCPDDADARAGRRIYLIESDCYISRLHIPTKGLPSIVLDKREDPHLDANVFVRMGSRKTRAGFYYFPYSGYQYICAGGQGPVDEFGFRNDVDIKSLAGRDANHKLIAVFGGSAAYGIRCLHQETFPVRLQERLRGNKSLPENCHKVTVLNFAISGHLMLHQMNAYLLFCAALSPDIVISHDGYNDLVLGMLCDTRLLSRNAIAYVPGFEEWAQQLHDAQHVELTQPKSSQSDFPFRIINSPKQVIGAYLERKGQFKKIVEGFGGKFVWGLQPLWYAKRLSQEEVKTCATDPATTPRYAPTFERIPFLYAELKKRLAALETGCFVDVHAAFSCLGTDLTLFADPVHLTPAGDDMVAEIYEPVILDLLKRGGA